MDILIKNVPEEAVANIKELAAVAVRRYLQKSVVPSQETTNKFESDISSFLVANGLEDNINI